MIQGYSYYGLQSLLFYLTSKKYAFELIFTKVNAYFIPSKLEMQILKVM